VSAPKPFRFGVHAASPESAVGWREQARRIEALGYSTLFMPDHYVGTPLAVMPALAFAAEATTTLRIGMLVLGNDYKHPAVTAKEAATLDVLSDGRLEFGLGAGWMTADYEALGLPYDSAGIRIARLEEALHVVKGAWAPGPFSFSGTHYEIRDYDAVPKPVQQPHPPILIGGGGPKVLRFAGRVADIVGINPNLRAGEIGVDAARDSLEELTTQKIGWVREGAGDRFDEIELQIRYQLTAITDDARGLAEQLAPMFGITADEALASSVVLAGTVDHVCDTLVQRRKQWGASYVVVGGDAFDAFAPVVARLAGT
jgi:probable F420-dependent oxidoreductase